MRLHLLELTGFGPFRQTQRVDFDAFAADGIFLITGRTGAGKSSVLDGVSFALYGDVPRYEGADKRLRSDHCLPEEPTVVVLEFSTGSGRWRVTRSPEYERPKQRGTGMTTEPHRASLEEWVDGAWVGRAARPVDVGTELDAIVGLSRQQFQQVVLLAQNRFAQFLHAKNDDRQTLLRKLFGTRTYEQYQSVLEDRRRASEQDLESARAAIDRVLADADRLIAADGLDDASDAGPDAVDGEASTPVTESDPLVRLDGFVRRARERAASAAEVREVAEGRHRDADARHAVARQTHATQLERDSARHRLDLLEQQRDEIAGMGETIERARRAEALRDVLRRADDTRATEREARAHAETATAVWTAATGSEAPGPTELDALLETITGDLARVEQDRAAESEHVRAGRERDALLAAIEESLTKIARLDQETAAFPEQLATLDEEAGQAHIAAAGQEAAAEADAALRRRLRAAREAETLLSARDDAERRHLGAGEAAEQAQAAVSQLLRRRLAGHAGELAAALVPGEPCAVCGSTQHPHPAARGEDPVSDDDIAAAERARDTTAAELARIASLAQQAREAYAEARTRAGEETPAALEELVREAGARVEASRAAAERAETLRTKRTEIVTAAEEARADREAREQQLARDREALAAVQARAEAAQAAVDRARGAFATIAARIDDLRARRDAGAALAQALRSRDDAIRAAAQARADAEGRVSASGFETADEARAALRESAVLAELEERVRSHEVSVSTERERLRDLDLRLATAPAEPVDLAASEAALVAARDAWSGAMDAAVRAEQTAALLADAVARARAETAAVARRLAAHAVLVRLADTVAGRAPNTHRMTLESFVLAAELEEIVAAANVRLDEMSSGRFALRHTDARAARGAASGLGLEILDAFTGQSRPAQSLSGGETFLASLALALGLAEVVSARAGGIRLDTLFIDEGFGSLDEETLEIAMRTLDELRQGGRTVGLISHVAAMKEQIPAQLHVSTSAAGPSVIRDTTRGG